MPIQSGNERGTPEPSPYYVPPMDEPPWGGGRLQAPPPQPPSFGGVGGGNPFASTLRSNTPLFAGRRRLGQLGAGGSGFAPSQFSAGPSPAPAGAGPLSARPGGMFGWLREQAINAAGVVPGRGGDPHRYDVSPTGAPRIRSPWSGPNGEVLPKQLMDYLVALGYDYGAFDPEGSSGLLNSLRHKMEEAGRGDMRRAQLGAQMYAYDDPMAQSYIRQNAEQSVRDRIALALAQAQAGSIAQNQGVLQQLLQAQLGPVLARDPRGPGSGDAWGDLLGGVIGAVVPGVGGLFGGGGGGGGVKMGQPGFTYPVGGR